MWQTVKVWHLCGIYDSFQTRLSTLTRTVHYLKLWQRLFSSLSNFFSLSFFPPHSNFPTWVQLGAKMRLCAGICTYVWESKGALCVWQRPWIAMWINGSLECGWRPLVSPANYSTALDGIPRCNRSPTKLCRDGRSTYHLHPAFGLSNAIFSPRVLKLLLISAWLDWKWSYISQLTENEKDQRSTRHLSWLCLFLCKKYSGNLLSFFVTGCTSLAFSSTEKSCILCEACHCTRGMKTGNKMLFLSLSLPFCNA